MFGILYLCFWLGIVGISGGEVFLTNVQAVGLIILMVTGYIFTRRIWRHCGKCQ